MGFYLSTDNVISTSDQFIGSRLIGPLAPGQSSSGNTTVNIPDDVAMGTHYVGAIVDYLGEVPEVYDNNNSLTGNPVDVLKRVLISRADQNIRVSFSGTAGQHVGLAVTGATIASGYVTIFDPNGNHLSSISIYFGGWRSTFDGDINAFFPVTGTYTILVNPSGYTGGLTRTLLSDLSSTIEVNGATVPVTISRAGQNTRVTFEGQAGQHIGLGVTEAMITPGNSIYITILKPDKTAISSTLVYKNTGMNAFLPVTGDVHYFGGPHGDCHRHSHADPFIGFIEHDCD